MTLGAYVTTISDAPSCAVTYNLHSDDSRGVIYSCNIFIKQATGLTLSLLVPLTIKYVLRFKLIVAGSTDNEFK